jgi:hypothetical protein
MVVTDSANTERFVIQDNGNIGIGTTAPSAKLQVLGSDSLSTSFAANISGATGTGLVVTNEGNIGIGTTSPRANLHVNYSGDDSQYAMLIDSSGSTINTMPTFMVKVPSTGNKKAFQLITADDGMAWASFEWNVGGTDKPGFALGPGGSSGRDVNLYRDSANILRTGDTLVVDGNVGIGTTAPGAKLHIDSDSYSSTSLKVSNNDGNDVFSINEDADGDGILYIKDKLGAVKNRIYANGDTYFNGGNIGIGTTTPSAKLQVLGSDSLSTSFAANISGATGTGLVVTNEGNIGIGTTAPGEKLEVAGNIMIADNGYITTNDAGRYDIYLGDKSTVNQYGNLWIKTSLNGNDGGLKVYPRDEAGSPVTYAHFSYEGNNDYAQIGTASNLESIVIKTSGNIGIGTTTPVAKLNVESGSDVEVARFSDELGNNVVIDKDGKVGIGTLAPSSKLDVSGNGRFYDQTAITGSTTLTIRAGAGQATNPLLQWQNNAGTGLGVIDEDGNLGIGTTTPGTLLELQQQSDNKGIDIYGYDDRSGVFGSFYVSSGGYFTMDYSTGGIYLSDVARISSDMFNIVDDKDLSFGNVEDFRIRYDEIGDDRLELSDGTNMFLTVKDQGTKADFDFNVGDLFIKNDGNVGIGTTTPNSKLSIDGGNISLNGGYLSGDGGDEGISVDNSGNIGIGTTGPLAGLDVQNGITATTGSAKGVNFEQTLTASANDDVLTALHIKPTFTDGAYTGVSHNGLIVEGGNVGIGDTTPSYKLTVDWNGDGTNVAYVNNSNAWTSGSADYAEYFYTKDTNLTSGEAVCVDLERENAVQRCERDGDSNIMGIVSTTPAFLGNAPAEERREDNKNYVIVGMLGQVPAKITNQNGNINPGDSLTASSIPGVLRKANSGESTVGIALSSFAKASEGQGTIQVMISRKNKTLTVSEVEQQVTQRVAQMEIEDEVNLLVSEAIDSLEIKDLVTELSQRFLSLEDFLANDQAQIISNYSNQIESINDQINDWIPAFAGMTEEIEILNQTVQDTAEQMTQLTLTVEGLNETDTMIIERLSDHENEIALLKADLLNVKTQIDPNYSNEIQMSNDLISSYSSLEDLGNLLASNEDEEGDTIFTLTADLELVNLKAERVETDELVISEKSSGRGVIEAGESEVLIESELVDDNSRIIITVRENNFDKNLYYGEVVNGESFKVKFNGEVLGNDIEFDWILIK